MKRRQSYNKISTYTISFAKKHLFNLFFLLSEKNVVPLHSQCNGINIWHMHKLLPIITRKSNTFARVLAIFCLCACAPDVCAQRASTTGVRPYGYTSNAAPTDSHWTLYLDAGGNWFDADYPAKAVEALYAPTVGLGFTYNFNPTWGLGLQGLYSPLRITKGEGESRETLFDAQMYRMQAVSSFDIINAWVPNNRHKIVALNVLVGGGAGIYKRDKFSSYKKDDSPTPDKTDKDDKFRFCPMIMAGADLQFNISRSVSLGLKATYTYFTKDAIDERIKGTNNDGIVDYTLSLRYKINAVKKSHVCNIANEDKFEERISKPKDNIKPAKADTVILVQKDTVIISNTVTPVQEVIADNNYYYIYFAPNQSSLRDNDLTVIQQVASRLQRDNNLYVEIVGYCDNTGSEQYNLQLGATRAHNVMSEFVEEYTIAPQRLVAYSGGIIEGRRSKAAYGPNRRVEIRLLNAGEFNAAKQRYDQAPKPSPAAERKAPAASNTVSNTASSKSSAPVIVDMQLSGKMVAKEVTRQDWTLSKMARKHYANTFCWVYIYMANKDRIANPDKVAVGLEVNIPELTESQQMITRRQADKILANLK